jgi:hypothetical protein
MASTGHFGLNRDTFLAVNPDSVGVSIAVRQVDSGGIHSRPTEEPEHVGLAASRADCGNNLGMLVHFLINSHACYSPLQRVGKASLRQSIRY